MSVRIDSKIIDLQVDPDERLAAAVGGAARYLADAAGLGIEAVVQMQKAIVSACQEAFEHLAGNHPHLEVTLTRYADRIEVALAYQGGAAPAVGLDRIAGMAQGLGIWSSAGSVLSGIDRVQYEAKGGRTVTRLTKYLGRAPHIV